MLNVTKTRLKLALNPVFLLASLMLLNHGWLNAAADKVGISEEAFRREQLITAQNNLDRAFREAVKIGDEIAVAKALEAGANVDTTDVADREYARFTALINAAQNGRKELVTQLIAAGADVNAEDFIRWTALMYAARNGHTEIVAQLITAGADVNARDGSLGSALMTAAGNGHAKVVAQLIAAGADAYARDHWGRTALMYAAKNGHAAVVAQLIAAGAGVIFVDAASHRTLAINMVDKTGATALMHATNNDHAAVAKLLEAAGAMI